MSAITLQLETAIESITRSFRDEFGDLTSEKLNWKPRPDAWSIGQVIHHLITVNNTYFPVADAVRKGNYKIPFWGKSEAIARFLGNSLLKYVGPDYKPRTKTFAVWQPSSSTIDADMVNQFVNHQSELIHFIKSCEDLVTRGVVIRSPGSRFVVYKLEKAFEIIVAHEQRHLIQARNVRHEMEILFKK
ncbi:MAG TPA: DinB family protein [Cyclobacteriaceae bacterium]|nr:DinB family protein [Cyclobacteriaceae bacterium]